MAVGKQTEGTEEGLVKNCADGTQVRNNFKCKRTVKEMLREQKDKQTKIDQKEETPQNQTKKLKIGTEKNLEFFT